MRDKLFEAWRESKPTLTKALNQWVDGDDARHSRVVVVVGDAPAVAALTQLIHSAEQGWGLRDQLAAVVRDDRLVSPVLTALAGWLVPADVLAIAVPGEVARLSACLDAQRGLRAVWVWRDPYLVASTPEDTDEDWLVAALADPARANLSPGLATQLAQALGLHPVTARTASLLRWVARHAGLLSTGLVIDPRVRVVHEAALADAGARSGLLDWLGLSGAGALSAPDLPAATVLATDVPPSVRALVEDVASQLRAAGGQAVG